MAILSHAMQEQVWTFLRIYTPETHLFFLAQPLELLSPVPFPARGLGRMPVHHGKSMQRKLPSRRSKWLAAQPAITTEPASILRNGKKAWVALRHPEGQHHVFSWLYIGSMDRERRT